MKLIGVASIASLAGSFLSNERNRRILHSFWASVLAKGVATLAMLVMTPLAYKYLGAERFGLLMTITSLLAVMQYADFGIGNGLLNAIAEAYGQNDRPKAQRAVSSAVLLLSFIAVLIAAIFAVACPHINWGKLLNIAPSLVADTKQSAVVFIACLALNLPLLTAQRVQMGYQEGFQANLWTGLGSLVSLAGVVTLIWLGKGVPWLVFALVGGPVVAAGLNWLHQFVVVRPWLRPRLELFNLAMGRHLSAVGLVWMMFQVMAFVGTGIDNLIISRLFGQQAVAGYSIMAKLFSGLLIAQFISAPLWPAFAEALERGDVDWARKTFRRALLLCTGIGVVGALLLACCSKWIVSIWVGPEMIPSDSLAFGFAAWCLIANLFAAISALMAGNRFLRKLLALTTVGALTSLALKFVLGKAFGVSGIVWASVIGYGIICLPALIIVRHVLRHPIMPSSTTSHLALGDPIHVIAEVE